MSLFANQLTVININAPNVIIKVLARNSHKKITTIHGLCDESKNGIQPYFNKEMCKKISSELRRICAAGTSIIKNEKIICVQGDNANSIKNYLIKCGIPEEKIKIKIYQ